MEIIEEHRSPDGLLRLIVTRDDDGDVSIGFDSYAWHTHGDIQASFSGLQEPEAVRHLVEQNVTMARVRVRGASGRRNMAKVSCVECGASILESTAHDTGGLCMPCKQGTRESIEAGKRWAQDERERELHDPYRKLWRELVHRAYNTAAGFAGFTESEKQYFAVCLLDGEVYNGGFDQYFFNDSGSYYKYAVHGLRAMGATKSLELLEAAAIQVFDNDTVLEDTRARRKILIGRIPSAQDQTLDSLDRAYWLDPDGLAELLEGFAVLNGFVATTE